MSEQLRSILIGTLGLDAALIAAVILAWRSPGAVSLGPAPAAAIALQGVHFAEEYATGFHLRYPELLGLAPWPAEFFLWFNALWLAVFAIAALAGPRFFLARAALWFLAIAGVLNGLAHPALAFAVQHYFPGLLSSPVLGAAGAWLAIALARPPAG